MSENYALTDAGVVTLPAPPPKQTQQTSIDKFADAVATALNAEVEDAED